MGKGMQDNSKPGIVVGVSHSLIMHQSILVLLFS